MLKDLSVGCSIPVVFEFNNFPIFLGDVHKPHLVDYNTFLIMSRYQVLVAYVSLQRHLLQQVGRIAHNKQALTLPIVGKPGDIDN